MDVFRNQNIEQTLLQMYQKVTLFSRFLQGFQIGLQLNTRAFAATYHAHLLEEQKHPKTVNEFWKNPLYIKKVPLTTPPRIRLQARILLTRNNNSNNINNNNNNNNNNSNNNNNN